MEDFVLHKWLETQGSITIFLLACFAFFIPTSLFWWCWFPHSVFDLGCNPGTWLSLTLPFLIPSFHLTSDNVVQPYRDSSFSYQTTIWKTRAIITHFWCCSVIPVVRGAIHIPSHSSYNISGQHKTNTTPLRHFCIMLPKGSSWCTISGGLIAAFSSRSCIKYQNHKGLLPFKSSSPWKDPLCWLFHSRRNE